MTDFVTGFRSREFLDPRFLLARWARRLFGALSKPGTRDLPWIRGDGFATRAGKPYLAGASTAWGTLVNLRPARNFREDGEGKGGGVGGG